MFEDIFIAFYYRKKDIDFEAFIIYNKDKVYF